MIDSVKMKYPITHNLLKIAGLILVIVSCQGAPSKKPPIHPNPNMDNGEYYESQEINPYFADGRAMRTPVEGTIARGFLNEDDALNLGKTASGKFIKKIPLTVDKAFILRGKEQYDIFCTPCHGGIGDGRGMVVDYGLVPPPSYHDDRLREVEDGYLYDVITNGVRSMYGYESQIPSQEDRWAIVAYIRTLQKSQNATEAELAGYKLTDAEKDIYYKEQLANMGEKEAMAKRIASMSTSELVSLGSELYTTKTCNTCHSLDGSKMVGPSFKGSYGRIAKFTDGTSTKADEEYLTTSILNSNEKIVEGYIAAMPNFNDLLNDLEVKALVEYIKTIK